MKKTMLAVALVCLLAAGAAAQVKVIQCAPACNLARKTVHVHALSHVARQSPASLAKHAFLSVRFVVRHPVATLKDIF